MRDVKGFAFLAVCLLGMAVFVVKVVIPVCDWVAPAATCQKLPK